MNSSQTKVRKNEDLSNAEIVVNDTFKKLRGKNKRRHAVRNIFIITLSLIALAVFAVLCFTVFFKVGDITVEGSAYYSDGSIIKCSGIEVEQSLFAFNEAEIRKRMIDRYPYIKDVHIKRRIPSSVVIYITEDTPSYYVKISEEYFVLSDTLRVLEYTSRIDDLNRHIGIKCLRLSHISRAITGQQMQFTDDDYYDTIVNALAVMNTSTLFDNISLFNFSDKFALYFVYDNRFKVIYGTDDDIMIKLELAREIINSFDEGVADGSKSKGTIDVQDITKGFAILENDVDLS